jgi:hypothetical protein
MDQQGPLKKIKDANFNPLPTASTSEVKTYQSPLGSCVTRDELAEMIHEFFEILTFNKFNLTNSWIAIKRRKRNMNLLFFLVMPLLVDRPRLVANFNTGCRSIIMIDNKLYLNRA